MSLHLVVIPIVPIVMSFQAEILRTGTADLSEVENLLQKADQKQHSGQQHITRAHQQIAPALLPSVLL